MAEKHRLVLNGKPKNFTCENARFKTDMKRGFSHLGSKVRGSALKGPLAEVGEHSLWLEHIVDKRSPKPDRGRLYWLMWYHNGIPTIPMSGVLTAEDLRKASSLLSGFSQSQKH